MTGNIKARCLIQGCDGYIRDGEGKLRYDGGGRPCVLAEQVQVNAMNCEHLVTLPGCLDQATSLRDVEWK